MITTVSAVDDILELTDEETRVLQKISKIHPIRVSEYYMSLIDESDPNDPIRKMAIPSEHELSRRGSYDTSGERENTIIPGLQHKYRQTALLLATSECATYCRHCFRKRLVGLRSNEVTCNIKRAAEYIQNHTEINNVLVTGGDPFTLSTRRIAEILRVLSGIDHLDFIRFGTRTPVTYPSRILGDRGLLTTLKAYSREQRRVYVVTQFNHPREITDMSAAAVSELSKSGVQVNNQTVLLKGVNDNPETLASLQNSLVRIGVNPYYVFQCRPVKRVKEHFQVPLYRGYHVLESAKKLLNGHSKRFRYIMSHPTGKIEIIGIHRDHFIFKYHQAKYDSDQGRIFMRAVDENATWLDDLI